MKKINSINQEKITIIFCYALLCVLLLTDTASAQAGNAIESGVNKLVTLLTSGIARGVAICACAFLGYMAFVGKLTWERVLMFIGGGVLVFGGATIVDWISKQ